MADNPRLIILASAWLIESNIRYWLLDEMPYFAHLAQANGCDGCVSCHFTLEILRWQVQLRVFKSSNV